MQQGQQCDNPPMVSVVHSLPASAAAETALPLLAEGLPPDAATRVMNAYHLAASLYGSKVLGTGEPALDHAVGLSLLAKSLELDADARVAALLFAVADFLKDADEHVKAEFGSASAEIVSSLARLKRLRPLTRAASATEVHSQTEILRKMLLAMATDIRVVILRLSSRTQTLRYLGDHPGQERDDMARESLSIYAPLANRLGVWQLKWELEDRSFRYLEPETYKRIAGMLDEKRTERQSFIESAVQRLKDELAALNIEAEVYGRPKHIYSIWNKMRGKNIDFEKVYDVRAMRIVVDELKDCYAALGIVHHLWQPIHGEFDDYISHPKGNYYRSLHTAVRADDGRSLEVQIRTREMHDHAELGVAAHWRYKESGSSAKASGEYEDKIAWLRQLLSWRDEITDSAQWVEQFKRAALDDTLYVLTPQGKVIDLARGATPVDFAYRLHTDLGHRCRGARVNGHMVPLNTPLANGQQVEIITTKTGGPSRDWLNIEQGYLGTARARQKVKQWFAALEETDLLAQGRAIVARELQREGQTHAGIDDIAGRLGLKNADALYLAAARSEISSRQLQIAIRGVVEPIAPEPEILTKKSKASTSDILVVGVDKLLTQIGLCCKPMPPDQIAGFVTRGKGVSIHRLNCKNFRNMAARNPERVIPSDWGAKTDSVYPIDLRVEASDRQGLLRDISDVFSREKINVTSVNTLSRAGNASMAFTVELTGAAAMKRMMTQLAEVSGVISVRRG
jgi:GTP pyrophosphokinase